jgi:hypothetical protein
MRTDEGAVTPPVVTKGAETTASDAEPSPNGEAPAAPTKSRRRRKRRRGRGASADGQPNGEVSAPVSLDNGFLSGPAPVASVDD